MILPLHLHPMVVHFPIVLFITSLAFEDGGCLVYEYGIGIEQ